MEMKKNYVAWYRKYRPQKFSDIVGQKFLLESLKNIIKSNKFFHAYLFSGPRGTGKTSVAKIFANAINCTHRQNSIDACKNCIANLNNSLDIIEMDAASHNGVKEIREIIENLINLPQVSPYKIYILDEVHMLSNPAFNAFLKTLEEPPKHMIFILATTEVHKIPLTILSRVQRYNFLGLGEKEICNQLKFILEKEKIKYEKEALKSIFLLSQSSLRDAISILEQVITFGNGVLNQKNIIELFGLVNKEILVNFVNALFLNDSKISFEILEQISLQSKNFRLFLESLINLVKEWIIWQNTKTEELLEFYNIIDLNNLKISYDFAFKFLEIAFSSLKDINFGEFQYLTLEIFVMRILAQNNDIIKKLNNLSSENLSKNKIEIIKKTQKNDAKNHFSNFQKTKELIEKSEKFESKDLEFDTSLKNQESYSSIPNPKLDQNLKKNSININVFSKSNVEFKEPNRINTELISSAKQTTDKKNIRNSETFYANSNLESENKIEFSSSSLEQENSEKEVNVNNTEKIYDDTFTFQTKNNEKSNQFLNNSDKSNDNLFNFNLETNFDNNTSKFIKEPNLKDYLSAKDALNFMLLGKDFYKQDPSTYKNLTQNWDKNLPLFEYNDELLDIVNVLKYAKIISLGPNFVCFIAKNDEYEDLLIETIKENRHVNELLSQIFNCEMHAVAFSKKLVNETKIMFNEFKSQGKKITTKPFKPPKQKSISKTDLEKLFFDK